MSDECLVCHPLSWTMILNHVCATPGRAVEGSNSELSLLASIHASSSSLSLDSVPDFVQSTGREQPGTSSKAWMWKGSAYWLRPGTW